MKRLIAIALIVSACSLDSKSGSSDIVPLAVGNSWNFVDSFWNKFGEFAGVDSNSISIVGSKTILWEGQNLEVFLWRRNSYTEGVSYFARIEDDGLCFYGGTNGDSDFVIGRARSVKYPVTTGEQWSSVQFAYRDSDAIFRVVDTVEWVCRTTSDLFETRVGSFIAYGYQAAGDVDSVFQQITYMAPGIGQVGFTSRINGVLKLRSSLTRYHLN